MGQVDKIFWGTAHTWFTGSASLICRIESTAGSSAVSSAQDWWRWPFNIDNWSFFWRFDFRLSWGRRPYPFSSAFLMFMFILSPMFVSPQLTTEAATIRNRYWSMEIFGVHSETFPKRHSVTPWNAKTYPVWRVIRFDDTCEGSNFNPAKAFD